MALSPNINSREFQKFRDAGNDLTRVAVTDETTQANTSGISDVKSVGTTAVLASVGVANLDDRKVVILEARAAGISWSFDPAFTYADGHKLFKDSIKSIPVGDGVSVYLIATAGTINCLISEVA